MKIIYFLILALLLVSCNKSIKDSSLFEGSLKSLRFVGYTRDIEAKRHVMEIKEGLVRIHKDFVLVLQLDGTKTYIPSKELISVSFE